MAAVKCVARAQHCWLARLGCDRHMTLTCSVNSLVGAGRAAAAGLAARVRGRGHVAGVARGAPVPRIPLCCQSTRSHPLSRPRLFHESVGCVPTRRPEGVAHITSGALPWPSTTSLEVHWRFRRPLRHWTRILGGAQRPPVGESPGGPPRLQPYHHRTILTPPTLRLLSGSAMRGGSSLAMEAKNRAAGAGGVALRGVLDPQTAPPAKTKGAGRMCDSSAQLPLSALAPSCLWGGGGQRGRETGLRGCQGGHAVPH